MNEKSRFRSPGKGGPRKLCVHSTITGVVQEMLRFMKCHRNESNIIKNFATFRAKLRHWVGRWILHMFLNDDQTRAFSWASPWKKKKDLVETPNWLLKQLMTRRENKSAVEKRKILSVLASFSCYTYEQETKKNPKTGIGSARHLNANWYFPVRSCVRSKRGYSNWKNYYANCCWWLRLQNGFWVGVWMSEPHDICKNALQHKRRNL